MSCPLRFPPRPSNSSFSPYFFVFGALHPRKTRFSVFFLSRRIDDALSWPYLGFFLAVSIPPLASCSPFSAKPSLGLAFLPRVFCSLIPPFSFVSTHAILVNEGYTNNPFQLPRTPCHSPSQDYRPSRPPKRPDMMGTSSDEHDLTAGSLSVFFTVPVIGHVCFLETSRFRCYSFP